MTVGRVSLAALALTLLGTGCATQYNGVEGGTYSLKVPDYWDVKAPSGPGEPAVVKANKYSETDMSGVESMGPSGAEHRLADPEFFIFEWPEKGPVERPSAAIGDKAKNYPGLGFAGQKISLIDESVTPLCGRIPRKYSVFGTMRDPVLATVGVSLEATPGAPATDTSQGWQVILVGAPVDGSLVGIVGRVSFDRARNCENYINMQAKLDEMLVNLTAKVGGSVAGAAGAAPAAGAPAEAAPPAPAAAPAEPAAPPANPS